MHMLVGYKLKSVNVLAATIASVILITHSANAQEGPPEIQAINITGSRILRDGYDMPTPVSVLGETEINAEAP